MKRVDLWMIGIGLSLSVGLLTVKPGYAEKKDRTPKCTLATLKGPVSVRRHRHTAPSSIPG